MGNSSRPNEQENLAHAILIHDKFEMSPHWNFTLKLEFAARL